MQTDVLPLTNNLSKFNVDSSTKELIIAMTKLYQN